MRPSRPRRRRDKREAHQPRRNSSIIAICICIIAALLLLRIDVNSADQSSGKTQEFEQCRDSCHRAIVKEYKIENTHSSHDQNSISSSLASSAVDAMFSFRNGDLRYSNDADGTGTGAGTPSDASRHHVSEFTGVGTRNNSRHPFHTQDVSNNYMDIANSNRPQHLPPLIDSLVGKHSSDEYSTPSRPIVRPVRRRSSSSSTEDLKMKGIKEAQIHSGDNTVAMVAAAAAAAVWSEAGGRRGRSFRMKAYNNEWDEALRWISTWGQNHQEQSHHQHRSGSQSRGSGDNDGADHQRSRSSRSGKQQQGIDDGRDSIDKRGSSSHVGFDQLLDICTRKCVGGDFTGNQGRKTSTPVPRGDDESKSVLLSMGTSQILPANLLSQNFNISPHSRRVARNVFGIIFSTALILLIRNVFEWWKLNRYSTSLQELLLEESRASIKRGKNRGSGKKQKRQRKKREIRTSNNSQQSNDNILSSNVPTDEKWNEMEEDSDSEDPVHQMYLMREGRKRRANIADSHSDQASKCTNSTASHTTTDTIQTQSSDVVHVFKQQDNQKKESSKLDSVPVEVKSPSLNDHDHGYRQSYPVPTDAQREEAYQKLKAFQQIQLKKIVEHKRRLRAATSTSSSTSPTKKLSMRDVVLMNTRKESDSSKNVARVPPGLSVETGKKKQMLSNTFAEDSIQNQKFSQENDVDLMLSSILDDDENATDLTKAFSGSHSFEDNTNMMKNVKSVALGDLLVVGSFGDSMNQTSPTRPASNPWKNLSPRGDRVFNHASVDAGSSEQVDLCTDANVQLQVSAAEFMPSWGKGDSAKGTKIW